MFHQVDLEKEKSNDLFAFCEHFYNSIKVRFFLNYRMNTYSYYMVFLSLGVPHLIIVEEARFTIKPPPRVLVHTQMRHYRFFGAQCMLWSM